MAIAAVILIVCYLSFSIPLSFILEHTREAYESGDYCKCYKNAKWAALLSSEGKYLLGTLYASGFCVTQDIPQAKKLFSALYKNDSVKIGETLFYDALEVSDSDKRNNKGQQPQVLKALFLESQSLGFKPAKKDLAELEKRNLKAEYSKP